jgi:hypothetical protein
MSTDREALGRLVRDTWTRWAAEQPDPKASWLVPWEALSEPEREVDRLIGEAVAVHVLADTGMCCAACLYVGAGVAAQAVTVMAGYAVCEDHQGEFVGDDLGRLIARARPLVNGWPT